jgi:hypothetical protein
LGFNRVLAAVLENRKPVFEDSKRSFHSVS